MRSLLSSPNRSEDGCLASPPPDEEESLAGVLGALGVGSLQQDGFQQWQAKGEPWEGESEPWAGDEASWKDDESQASGPSGSARSGVPPNFLGEFFRRVGTFATASDRLATYGRHLKGARLTNASQAKCAVKGRYLQHSSDSCASRFSPGAPLYHGPPDLLWLFWQNFARTLLLIKTCRHRSTHMPLNGT